MKCGFLRRLFFSVLFCLGCDQGPKTPGTSADADAGSLSGAYNPDGVEAVISGQVLLQGAAEGGHGDTRVAAQGYASTAVTNAQGQFRLSVVIAPEDVTRSDEDADGPLSVEVMFTHSGYRPAQRVIPIIKGGTATLEASVTLEVIDGRVFGQLVLPSGLNSTDFSDVLRLTLSTAAGANLATTFDAQGVFTFEDVEPGGYVFSAAGGPFNRAMRELVVSPGDQVDLGDVVVQLKESERLNYETAIEGSVKLQGVTDDNGHGGIRVESVGTAFATVTASTGRYRLALEPGTHTLKFGYPGFGTQILEVTEVMARQTTRISDPVVLPARPGRVTGSVRLAQFETPSRLQSVDVVLLNGADDVVLSVNPDASGRFVFDEVAAGDWRVKARCDGYVSRSGFVVLNAGASVEANPLTLAHQSTTAEAVSFAGRVTLSDSTSHEGTVVKLRMQPDDLVFGETTTAADGSFTLPVSGEERYTVSIIRAQYASVENAGPFTYDATTFLNEAGATPEWVLNANPGRIAGTVRLAQYETAGRLQAVDVALIDGADATAHSVNPDASGRFVFESVAAGAWRVQASRAGYSAGTSFVQLDAGASVEANPLTLAHQSTTAEAVSFAGRVTLSDSASHEGTVVKLRMQPDDLVFGETTTAADGSFALPVSDEERYTVSIIRAQYTSVENAGPFTYGGTTFFNEADAAPEWVLSANPGRIAGTVRLAQYETAGRLQAVDVALIDGADATVQSVNPDASGRFVFESVAAGAWRVQARRAGYSAGTSFVQLDAGASVEANPLTLAHQSTTAEAVGFSGRVTLSDGASHEGTVVKLRMQPDDLVFGETTTAADGSFTLPVSDEERYTVSIIRAQYASVENAGPFTYDATTFLNEAGTAPEWVLSANPGRIAGTVRLAQYETAGRLQAVDVALIDGANATVQSVNPDASGRFVFESVAAGAWRVQASRAGYRAGTSFVQLDAGASVEANPLTLAHQSTTAEAVRFSGRVTLANLADHSGTEIRLVMLPDALLGASMSTRTDGSFDVPAAADERYEVVVVRPRFEVPQGWGPFTYNGTAFVDADDNPAQVTLSAFAGPEGDTDGDGVLNGVDNCPSLANPDQANHEGDAFGDVCDADDDNDGLNDTEEVLLGTDPLLVDTDNDGLNDLFEQRGQTDPLEEDTDGDLILDGNEITDLDNPEDYDGDRLWDAVESNADDADRDGAKDYEDGPGPLGDLDGGGVKNGEVDDEVCTDPNGCDNCPLIQNADQLDTDGDSKGDACDTDDDGDGFADISDNCPLTAGPQQDLNGDGEGDVCDPDDDGDGLSDVLEAGFGSNPNLIDTDGDGIPDGDGIERLTPLDNCVTVPNPDQRNTDKALAAVVPEAERTWSGDGLGDACDDDDDNDGVLDDARDVLAGCQDETECDNCRFVRNGPLEDNQRNLDGDQFGDACDSDDDNDDFLDPVDNCPEIANGQQTDFDVDGLGDLCDDDDDNDGVLDADDNCPLTYNPPLVEGGEQSDLDGDGIGDVCSNDIDNDGVDDGADNCIYDHNPDQRDIDADGVGDACDDDVDGDRLANINDNCDRVFNPEQKNQDGDAFGDACDDDLDGDGVPNLTDSCPRKENEGEDPDGDNIDSVCDNCDDHFNLDQRDLDRDGDGDACDDDDDGDNFDDDVDNCPLKANIDQKDRDGDGRGDACSVFFVNHLSDRNIQDMASDANQVWVASTGGATHWLYDHETDTYTTTRHTTASGMPGNLARDVAIDAVGNPYFIIEHENSVFRLYTYLVASDEWREVVLPDVGCSPTPVTEMVDVKVENALDANGVPRTKRIYVAYKNGVVYGTPTEGEGGFWNCWPSGSGIPNNNGAVVKEVHLAPIRDGESDADVWVVTDTFGLARYRWNDLAGSWLAFTPPSLADGVITGFGFVEQDTITLVGTVVSSDEVWLNTPKGKFRIGQDGSIVSLSSVEHIDFIHVASWNNRVIALGTDKFRAQGQGATLGPATAVVRAPHGEWWHSTAFGLMDSGRDTKFDGFGPLQISGDGGYVLKGFGDEVGVVKGSGGEVSIHDIPAGTYQDVPVDSTLMRLDRAHSLIRHNDGFAGIGDLIWYWDGNQLQTIDRYLGFGSGAALASYDGALWVTSDFGIGRIDFDEGEVEQVVSFVTPITTSFEDRLRYLAVFEEYALVASGSVMYAVDLRSGTVEEAASIYDGSGSGPHAKKPFIRQNDLVLHPWWGGQDGFRLKQGVGGGVIDLATFDYSGIGGERIARSVAASETELIAINERFASLLRADGVPLRLNVTFSLSQNLGARTWPNLNDNTLSYRSDNSFCLSRSWMNGSDGMVDTYCLARPAHEPRNFGFASTQYALSKNENGAIVQLLRNETFDGIGVIFDKEDRYRWADFSIRQLQLDSGTKVKLKAPSVYFGLEQMGVNEGLSNADINDIGRRNDDVLFLATDGGVAQFASARFTNFDLTEFGGSGTSNRVKRVIVDREDRVWAATSDGVFVYDGARWQRISGLPNEDVRDLVLGHDGTLWAATAGGLARRIGANEFVSFDLRNSTSTVVNPQLTSVDVMLDGRVLVGSSGLGLFVVHPNGVVDNFTVENGGLPSNDIKQVMSEHFPEGRAFVATSQGYAEYVAPPGIMDTAFCGDGLVAATEVCDDGGMQTVRCEVDCTLPNCGDGVVNQLTGEECDDGNTVDGDGCGQSCLNQLSCAEVRDDFACLAAYCEDVGEFASLPDCCLAYRFDGPHAKLRIKWVGEVPTPNDLTVEAWVKHGAELTANRLNYAYLLTVLNGPVWFEGNEIPEQSGWHHLARVFDSEQNETRKYVNGNLVNRFQGSIEGCCDMLSLSTQLFVGGSYVDNNRGFIGEMQGVRISTSVRYVGEQFDPPHQYELDEATWLVLPLNGVDILVDTSGRNHVVEMWDGGPVLESGGEPGPFCQ